MIKYHDDDFEIINILDPPRRAVDFILSDLLDDVLHQIRLFRVEKSKELEKMIVPFFRELYPYLFDDVDKMSISTKDFESVRRLKYTVRSIDKTRKWLNALEIPAQTKMILSYDFQTSLEMPWSTFLASYEKLCYGGLDDICIFSANEQWYLLYYHEDIFLFGKRSTTEE